MGRRRIPRCGVLGRQYGVTTVRGDRYAGEWPRERFRVQGIAYRASDRSKGELYGAFLPALNSGRVELLDHARVVAQFCALERRTTRGGRDSIETARRPTRISVAYSYIPQYKCS